VRAFVAITLSEANLDVIELGVRAFRDAEPSWAGEKWVRTSHIHVTLAFMPDLPATDVDACLSSLAHAVGVLDPFAIALASAKAVPRPSRARMLWAEFEGDTRAARALADATREATSPWRDNDDSKPFTPHATLCRARRPRPIDPPALAALSRSFSAAPPSGRTVSVLGVTLFSSVLGRSGPTYESLGTVPLGAD
jgi:2'-5' RNA ligase